MVQCGLEISPHHFDEGCPDSKQVPLLHSSNKLSVARYPRFHLQGGLTGNQKRNSLVRSQTINSQQQCSERVTGAREPWVPESEEEAPPGRPAVIWQDQGTSIPGRVNCSPKERATAHYLPRLSHLVWLESREDLQEARVRVWGGKVGPDIGGGMASCKIL